MSSILIGATMKHEIKILYLNYLGEVGDTPPVCTIAREVKLTVDNVFMEGTIIYTANPKMTKYTLRLNNSLLTKHEDYKSIRRDILNLCRGMYSGTGNGIGMNPDVIFREGKHAPKKKVLSTNG
jgi:hypothetical protein